ncbi:MAG: LolA family protein [Gemmatimonadota bacterium]
MKKIILGVALAGVAASIAIVAQSHLRKGHERSEVRAVGTAAPVDTQPAVPQPAPPVPQPAPALSPAPATTTAPAQTPAAKPVRRPYVEIPVIENSPAEQATGATVLRRAAAAYARVKTLQADFALERDNPLLGSTTTSSGTLYQKRPDLFLMRFSDPAGDVIVSDGQYFWLYYPSADKRQVLRARAQTGAAGGVDLQAQFLGDPLTRFTHTYHGKQMVNGRSTHVLTMVPRQNVGYQSLKVWIDEKDALVRRFVLTENNGLVQDFTLSGLVVNTTLSNDLFKFTPPPDARIIENM